MGKKTGLTMLGVGVFLLAMGLLSQFYAYGQLAVVPLNQNTVSYSEGSDATVFDIAGKQEITTDLLSTGNVVGDVAASKKASTDLNRDIAVWEKLTYTTKPGAVVSEATPPLSASHDRIAFDRHTGEVVPCCGSYISSSADIDTGDELRDTATKVSGLYYKFPFGTQKKTYQYWDGSLKKAVPALYKGTSNLDGLTVYKFEQEIAPTTVGQITAPASFFGIDEDGDVTLDRIYANTRTMWVEPETGVIIKSQEQQHAVAEYDGDEIATLTDVTSVYSDKTVDANVKEYTAKSSQLKMIRVWVPLIGDLLGVVLILLGLGLLLRRRSEYRRSESRREDELEREQDLVDDRPEEVKA